MTGPKGKKRNTKKTVGKPRKRKARTTGSGDLLTKELVHPFPNLKVYKLKYVTLINHGVGATNSLGTRQAFNLNSGFDIDLTNAGHQPYGYDTLFGTSGVNAVYNRYKVIMCEVIIDIFDPTEDALQYCWKVNQPVDTFNITGTNADTIAEQQWAGVIVLNTTGTQRRQLRQKIPIWKVSGLTKLQFDADPDNYTAAYNGNPASIPILQGALSSARSSGSGTVMVRYTLIQHIMGYDRNTMAQS